MPRPQCQSKSEVYTAITQQRLAGETNDCTVVATAAALNLPYAEAHALIQKHFGRKAGKGCQFWGEALRQLLAEKGFRAQHAFRYEFINNYPGVHKNLKSVTTHHPDRFPEAWADGHTYLLYTRGHVLCVKNGLNCDWSRGKAKRVTQIWRIVPL
jgi:hypothetical protein